MTKKRVWDTGTVRPYRPCPVDFREVFLRLGQCKEIEEHYATNWRIIIRWIEQSGGDDLRRERARLIGSELKLSPHRRSARYVMGRTLTAVTSRERKE
ncbi:hypothetical protein [Sphingomonas soli]|uniref:hypothetical protein n=1 Tax=Sphingomonas soli TaxID=266127 RepID=UPI0008346763|nr:hypothetical protein [Sphingomonas soli]